LNNCVTWVRWSAAVAATGWDTACSNSAGPGNRIRVWLDQELRLDAVVDPPLAAGRRRTFALSNYGESPVVRSLRVWKGVTP